MLAGLVLPYVINQLNLDKKGNLSAVCVNVKISNKAAE